MMRFNLAELRELSTLTAASPHLHAKFAAELAFLTRFNVGDRIWTGNLGWGSIESADDTSWRVRLEDPEDEREFMTISRRRRNE
jgi:hypothetical protein